MLLSNFSYHYPQIHNEQLFLPYISIQLLCTYFYAYQTIYFISYDKKESILKLLKHPVILFEMLYSNV